MAQLLVGAHVARNSAGIKGIGMLILRPKKGNIGLSDMDVPKMDEAFKIVKSAADAGIEHFASNSGAEK